MTFLDILGWPVINPDIHLWDLGFEEPTTILNLPIAFVTSNPVCL